MSAGYTRRFDCAVGLTIVTFSATPTASAGIVQLPLGPITGCVYALAAPDPNGVFFGPTFVGAVLRYYIRNLMAGTYVESVSPGAASARNC